MSDHDDPARPLWLRLRETLAADGRPPSRARVERWIRAGCVRVHGQVERDPLRGVHGAERVSVDLEDADAVPATRAPRAPRETPARTPPPWVRYADRWLVVVERSGLPPGLDGDALAAAVAQVLGLTSLVCLPGEAARAHGPVALAVSRGFAARTTLTRTGDLLTLKHPKTNRRLEFGPAG